MTYEIPEEYTGKTCEELFQMLKGKELRGKYIREDHKLVVKDLLTVTDMHNEKVTRVVLESTKERGNKSLSYVNLAEFDVWLGLCRFEKAVEPQ